mgnify:FL=1
MASNRTDLGKGIFSASAISTIEQCEMKAHYEYERGYETKTISNGLKTGIMMHEAQEMYLNGHNCSAVINSVEEEVKAKGWDEDDLLLPKLRAYIKGYYNAWEVKDTDSICDGKLELLSTEESFMFEAKEIRNSVNSFVGQMDAVFMDHEKDCIVLMEHKNVSGKDCQDPASIFWQSLIMNNQLTIYTTYLEQKYNKPVYVWYDVVLTSPMMKPKIIDRKTKERESIEQFEERITEVYMEEGLCHSYHGNRYIRKMIPTMSGIREQRMREIAVLAERGTRFYHVEQPTRNTQSCRNYGGCPFFQACVGNERLEESSSFQLKEHFRPKDTNDIPF